MKLFLTVCLIVVFNTPVSATTFIPDEKEPTSTQPSGTGGSSR